MPELNAAECRRAYDVPTVPRCRKDAGHEGPHEVTIAWNDSPSRIPIVGCGICGSSEPHVHPWTEWRDYAQEQAYEHHEDQQRMDEERET